jgi:hypothetical protein
MVDSQMLYTVAIHKMINWVRLNFEITISSFQKPGSNRTFQLYSKLYSRNRKKTSTNRRNLQCNTRSHTRETRNNGLVLELAKLMAIISILYFSVEIVRAR